MEKYKCSIIIPTFNRANLLKTTLLSISRQKKISLIHEILICDSSSDDETTQVIQEVASYLPDIVLKHLHTENNISKKRNLGINIAESDFLIFFDDDCELFENCIENHIKALSLNNKAIISGRVKFPQKQVDDSNYIRYRDSRHRYVDDIEDKKYRLSYKQIVTMNMAARKSELLEANLFFDENFLSYGMEDNEFGYRAEKEGFSLYLSKATIVHHDRHNFLTFKKKIFSTARDGTATLLNKYPEAVWDFYYSKYLEGQYPFHTFYSLMLSKLIRLFLFKSISNALTKFVISTDHIKFLFFDSIYRYILACEYLRGIKERPNRYSSGSEIKGNFYS